METIIVLVIAMGVWLFFRSRANSSKNKLQDYIQNARVCIGREDWSGAIDHLTRYLDDDPTNALKNNVSVYNLRATAYEQLGETQRASADWAKSLRIDSNQPFVRTMVEQLNDEEDEILAEKRRLKRSNASQICVYCQFENPNSASFCGCGQPLA
jgi:tetratricopeptide (TPR) repeat protein